MVISDLRSVLGRIKTIMVFMASLLGGLFWAGMAMAQSTSMFERSEPEKDLGAQWIRHIFKAGDRSETTFLGLPATVLQDALLEVLRFYSNGILVIGAFILLYHLVTMIAETAHTGKPMGRANQIWAPLRLVIAIGLIVPLQSGLNSGQYAVIKVAEWGSYFASNAWDRVLDTLRDSKNTLPPPDSGGELLYAALQSTSCAAGFNSRALCQSSGNAPGLNYNNPFVVALQRTRINAGAEQGTDILSFNRFNGGVPGGGEIGIHGDGAYKYGAWVGNGTAAMSVIPDNSKNADIMDTGTCGSFTIPAASDVTPNQDFNRLAREYREIYYQMVTLAIDQAYRITAAASVSEGRWFGCGNDTEDLSAISIGVNTASNRANVIGAVTQLNLLKTQLENKQKEMQRLIPVMAEGQRGGGEADAGAFPFVQKSAGWVSAGAWATRLAKSQQEASSSVTNLARYQSPEAMGVDEEAEKAAGAILRGVNSIYRTLYEENAGQPIAKNFDVASGSTKPGRRGDSTSAYYLESAAYRSGLWANTGDAGWVDGANSDGSLTGIGSALFGFDRFDYSNALGSLINIGIHKLSMMWWLVGFSMAAQALQAALASGAEAVGTPLTFWASMGMGFLSGAAGAVAGFLRLIAFVAFLPALLLAFVLPLAIFVRFLFGVLTWVVAVVEAVVAMPVFALAHLTPYGEGAVPDAAKRGYYLIFQIFLRPVLMVISLLLVIIMINAMVGLLAVTFDFAVSGARRDVSDLGIFTRYTFTIIFLVLAYTICMQCARLIDIIPKQVMGWLGQSVQDAPFDEGGKMDAAMGAVSGIVGFSAASQVSSMLNSGAGAGKSIGSTIGKGIKDRRGRAAGISDGGGDGNAGNIGGELGGGGGSGGGGGGSGGGSGGGGGGESTGEMRSLLSQAQAAAGEARSASGTSANAAGLAGNSASDAGGSAGRAGQAADEARSAGNTARDQSGNVPKDKA